MSPTLGNGKICYLAIPAADVRQSAAFYQAVVSWKIRQRSDGTIAFDDGVGQVSGTWVTDRSPLTNPGVLIYIMVDDVAATLDAVVAHGGKIVKPLGSHPTEIVAEFSDPTGNVFGLYQEPDSAA
jgi:predicted enzyme related to lactoylglutathione lyase